LRNLSNCTIWYFKGDERTPLILYNDADSSRFNLEYDYVDISGSLLTNYWNANSRFKRSHIYVAADSEISGVRRRIANNDKSNSTWKCRNGEALFWSEKPRWNLA